MSRLLRPEATGEATWSVGRTIPLKRPPRGEFALTFSKLRPDQHRVIHVVTIPTTLSFFHGQFSYLKRHGYDVSAVASPTTDFELILLELGIKGHGVPMEREIAPLKDLLSLVRLWSLFRRERPHIVHGHTPKGGFLSILAAWLARVPVRVYHLHGLRLETTRGLKRLVLMATEKLTCRLSHRVIAVSRSLAAKTVEMGICPPAKITVFGSGSVNGVDSEGRFNPKNVDPSARLRLREQYSIPVNALVIGFVGRIRRDKGIIELVDAWQIVSGRVPHAHLVVVGEFESGDPIPEEVRDRLVSDTRIHLTGRVTNMPEIYRMLDLVVLPTHREGLGQVLLEAAAMELPVVASRVTGCVDAVEDGVTGILVPPGDSVALANAILKYLYDADLRDQHGRAARKRVLDKFKPKQVWDALVAEYDTLLEKARCS